MGPESTRVVLFNHIIESGIGMDLQNFSLACAVEGADPGQSLGSKDPLTESYLESPKSGVVA